MESLVHNRNTQWLPSCGQVFAILVVILGQYILMKGSAAMVNTAIRQISL